ncbi:hypothetical protein [Stenotrophomonas sp. AB1(2024)]|uniref:hypothetical protein n=1 Tax=Stenotrophomonas sp. AB1(2024) TaxID=3132215 RepID=UPI0030A2959C
MASKQSQHWMAVSGLLLIVGSVGATVVPPPFVDSARAADPSAESSTTWYVDAELILLLQRQASMAVALYRGDADSERAIDVSVAIDMKSRAITADFGPGFVPGSDVAAKMLTPLAINLRHHAEQAGLPIHDVVFHIQGKPLKRYGPEDMFVSAKEDEVTL